MNVRRYNPNDRLAVLELLALNTPEYFDVSEKKDLEFYLENEIEDYYVVSNDNKIIGAGGINYFTSEKYARISWDFIHPEMQGKGIGRLLTEYRLKQINLHPEIDKVIVRTSQHVYKFYEKLNFNLFKITPDFWAIGYDLYEMEQKNN